MGVSIQDVKEVRELTGAGMMTVKKALEEAGGNKEEAIKAIRLAGQKSLSKREDRSTSNGLVLAKVVDKGDKQEGVMIELDSETDFVSKNDKFVAAAEKILAAAVASDATSPAELLEFSVEEGKVQDIVDGIGALFAEKIVLGKVVRLEGEAVSAYLHYSSADLPPQVGVLVATDKAAAGVAHDVALHVAAYSPSYLSREDVPAEEAAKERATLTEMTLAEGKPEKIVEKIVEGRMNAFYKEICLLDQDFAKDPTTTVGKIVAATGGKITGYARFHVGA